MEFCFLFSFLRMETEDPTGTVAEIKPTSHVQPRVYVFFLRKRKLYHSGTMDLLPVYMVYLL